MDKMNCLKVLERKIPYLIGLVSFVYYTILSAKEYTWMFVSSDSGDWLMCSNWWVVPQTYGSPLYISLARLVGTFPGDTVIVMTILLSCLPSAITVTLIYLIIHKLTRKTLPAIASSLVLLGAGVFLTQSTVLEEYALAIMFMTAAYYFYLHNKQMLTALALGLGTAIHIFILPIAVFWFVLHVLKEKAAKPLLKSVAVYFISGVLPYSLILVLMYLDTPRLLAGGLNFESLRFYLFGTGGTIIGTLSVFEAPRRILAMTSILLMSLGLAFVPIYSGLKRPFDTKTRILLMIVLVSLWYYLTSLDPLSWTFMCFALPSLAILVGAGLSKLTLTHTKIVIAGTIVLIIVNSMFLNANVLTKQNPRATTYYEELMSLPDHSVVVATIGSYSLGLSYVMSEGKNLIPILTSTDALCDANPDYKTWMEEKYGIEGSDTLERVQYALDSEYDVYFAGGDRDMCLAGQLFTYTTDNACSVRPVTSLSGVDPNTIEPEPPKQFWDEILAGYRR